MRLIDADTLSKTWQEVLDCHENEKDSVGYLAFELFIKRLKDEPTIDPVHAAGGCYCRECVHFMEYSDEYKNNYENVIEGATGDCFLRVMYSGNPEFVAVSKNDFCSYGRRWESRCEKD